MSLLPGLLAAADESASDLRKFRDPATEFELLRYTNPDQYSAFLQPPHLRSIARNNEVLICSDRSGSMQLWRVDLKDGEARQLTGFAGGVRVGAASLLPDDRTAVCIAENVLHSVGGARPRPLYESKATAETLAVAGDGRTCYLLERERESMAVRSVNLVRQAGDVVFEAAEVAGLRPRPRSPMLLYWAGGGLWLASPGTRAPQPLPVQKPVRQAFWTADGRSVLYLADAAEPGKPVQMREYQPESREDKFLANTSQFITFARNADSSVFVGASGSKGAPYVLLLLRVSRRELTLAEHRASDPRMVVVLFTPNSQRILFHSDRAGRSAIYGLSAEKLVEETEAQG